MEIAVAKIIHGMSIVTKFVSVFYNPMRIPLENIFKKLLHYHTTEMKKKELNWFIITELNR